MDVHEEVFACPSCGDWLVLRLTTREAPGGYLIRALVIPAVLGVHVAPAQPPAAQEGLLNGD